MLSIVTGLAEQLPATWSRQVLVELDQPCREASRISTYRFPGHLGAMRDAGLDVGLLQTGIVGEDIGGCPTTSRGSRGPGKHRCDVLGYTACRSRRWDRSRCGTGYRRVSCHPRADETSAVNSRSSGNSTATAAGCGVPSIRGRRGTPRFTDGPARSLRPISAGWGHGLPVGAAGPVEGPARGFRYPRTDRENRAGPSSRWSSVCFCFKA